MNYLGSKAKSGAYQAIITSMPPNNTYIETHLGSGVVIKHKALWREAIGIDLDGCVIGNFTGVARGKLHTSDAVGFVHKFDARKNSEKIYETYYFILVTN